MAGIMDRPEKLLQDEIIEIPEFLYESATTANASLRCDNLQTTCPGCMGAPGQCTNCEKNCQGCQGVACQSCQCSKMNNQGSPPASSGSVTISNKTDSSITFRLSAISGATSYVYGYRRSIDIATINVATSDFSNTITGLQPDTKYIINYYGENNYGTGPWMPTGATATTLKKRPTIIPWYWNASNGAGGSAGTASAAKTQAARRAILNEGCGEDFSFKVWNDLVNKINEVVVAIDASWANTYATLNGTRISGAGQDLTATKYNAAKQNVGSHYPTGIPEVNGKTEFTWSYIDKLATKLNEWIASL